MCRIRTCFALGLRRVDRVATVKQGSSPRTNRAGQRDALSKESGGANGLANLNFETQSIGYSSTSMLPTEFDRAQSITLSKLRQTCFELS